MKKYILITIISGLFLCCEEDIRYKAELENPDIFRHSMKTLTDVIVYDIFSPPVASRVYVYPCIAAYEATLPLYLNSFNSYAYQLHGLESLPQPTDKNINFHLAGIHAFLTVGTALIFSEDRMKTFQESLYADLRKKGLPTAVEKASLVYGQMVATHILKWAKEDHYAQTRTYPKYTIKEGDQYWKPTPPDYMEGIEPHWNQMRTLVLDSSSQYEPIKPVPFSMEEGSEFRIQLNEVYEVGVNLKEEEKAIAQFWDCNPYVSHHIGHAMFATKKITPGGHWIGITSIATKQAKSSFIETLEAFSMVSISLFDAFISCWDEKWRSIVVRPETIINQYLNEEWTPLLQTPPFPEYTSGHSVISRASAITLTNLYGDHFAFNDTTELEFGLPAREFESFIQASEEAAISRLYGGIHYMMAIKNGVMQGEEVGRFILSKVATRREDSQVAVNEAK